MFQIRVYIIIDKQIIKCDYSSEIYFVEESISNNPLYLFTTSVLWIIRKFKNYSI